MLFEGRVHSVSNAVVTGMPIKSSLGGSGAHVHWELVLEFSRLSHGERK